MGSAGEDAGYGCALGEAITWQPMPPLAERQRKAVNSYRRSWSQRDCLRSFGSFGLARFHLCTGCHVVVEIII